MDFARHDLTSDTSHSPFVVSSSSTAGAWSEWHMFDGDLSGSYGWICAWGATPCWVTIDLGSEQLVKSYALACIPTRGNAMASSFLLQGSNDNSIWINVDTRTTEWYWSDAGETRRYVCADQSTAYRYFHLKCAEENEDGGRWAVPGNEGAARVHWEVPRQRYGNTPRF